MILSELEEEPPMEPTNSDKNKKRTMITRSRVVEQFYSLPNFSPRKKSRLGSSVENIVIDSDVSQRKDIRIADSLSSPTSSEGQQPILDTVTFQLDPAHSHLGLKEPLPPNFQDYFFDLPRMKKPELYCCLKLIANWKNKSLPSDR